MTYVQKYPDRQYVKCKLCNYKVLRFFRGKPKGNRKLVAHFIEAHWDEGGEALYKRLEAEENIEGEQYVL